MSEPIHSDAVAIRAPMADDAPALARFAASIPVHDLLFLPRDIRQAKVVEAWLRGEASGRTRSLIALQGEAIIATVAVLGDKWSWSGHVFDIRLLVGTGHRNRGLGRDLLRRAIALATGAGATKLTARLTPDQTAAITLFEETGFRAEALLRDEVRDDAGTLHDLVVLAMSPARENALREAFGD